MTDWWYTERGQRKGPVSKDSLIELFDNGILKATDLLWSEGMTAWLPAKDVEQISSCLGKVPAAIPLLEESNVSNASYWRRYGARMIDLNLGMLITGSFSGFVLSFLNSYLGRPWFEIAITSWIYWTATMVGAITLYFVLEAWVVTFLGNSPGKALLGLRVVDASDVPLRGFNYFKRNLWVFTKGFGFSIPYVNLFAMFYQACRVRKGEPASYDVDTGNKVVGKPIGRLRGILAFCIVAVFVLGSAVLSFLPMWMPYRPLIVDKTKTSQKLSEFSRSWYYPLTEQRFQLPEGWKVRQETDKTGNPVFIFVSKRNFVIFGEERVLGRSLRAYVDALVSVTKQFYFWEPGSIDGGIYIGQGRYLKTGQTSQIFVYRTPSPDRFSRVIVIHDGAQPDKAGVQEIFSLIMQTRSQSEVQEQ